MTEIQGLPAGARSRAATRPEARGREVSWGKQTRVPPAAGAEGEPGHGSRRAAVTKPCQTRRSPRDTVTQRHTSGSLSFPHGGGLATNHGAPPQLPGGGTGRCRASAPRNPSLASSARVWSCRRAGQRWDTGQPGGDGLVLRGGRKESSELHQLREPRD